MTTQEEILDMTSSRPQPTPPESLAEINRAVFTFEFAPDKWSGLEEWREDVQTLFDIAKRFGMNSGRRTMTAEYGNIPADWDLEWGEIQ